MTEVDLARVEAFLGGPLPAHYRYFLRDHGAELRALKARHPEGVELYLEADDLIRANDEVRSGAIYIQFGDDSAPWPQEFLLIGGFPESGDHVLVNLDSPRERVYAYQHEGGCIVLPADFVTWAAYPDLVQERIESWERFNRTRGGGPDA